VGPFPPNLRNPRDAEYFYDNVALTNVDKVARKRNNLDSAPRKIHDKHYTLSEQIEILQPRLVWFPTGPSYCRYLKKALPEVRLESVAPGVEEVKGLRCLALKIYHPQYAKVFKAAACARYLRDHLRQEGCLP